MRSIRRLLGAAFLPVILIASAASAQIPIGFAPTCSAVYRDTLFFAGISARDNQSFPLAGVADAAGRPFETPVPFQAPGEPGLVRVVGLAIYQGSLAVVGSFNLTPSNLSGEGILLYDGTWQRFPREISWPNRGLTDVLVSGGVLYLAGRFKDPATGVTENVVAFDGRRWRGLGLRLGWQYVTHLAEYQGGVIAAAGIRGSGLDEKYHRRTVLQYEIHRWDGNTWTPLRADEGGMPAGMTVFGNDLYVSFMTMREAGEHASVLRFDGDGWDPVGETFSDGSQRSFVNLEALGGYEGHLVAAGRFDRMAGTQMPGAAYWESGAWRALEIAGLDNPRCLATTKTGLWVGQARAYKHNELIRWNGQLPVDASPVPAVEPTSSRFPSGPETAAFRNGDFRERGQGVPTGWRYDAGPLAMALRPAVDAQSETDNDSLSFPQTGGVILPPTADGVRGRALYQKFPAREGQFYRVKVRARYLPGDSGQPAKSRLSLSVGSRWDRAMIAAEEFQWYQLDIPGSARNEPGKVSLRNDGDGRLEIARVVLEEHDLDFAAMFDGFCAEFGARYTRFATAPVAWDSLVTRWRPTAATAVDCVAFANIISEMLSALTDADLKLESRSSDVIAMHLTYSDPTVRGRESAINKRAKALYRGSPLRDGVRPKPRAEILTRAGRDLFYLSLAAAWYQGSAEIDSAQLAEVKQVEGVLLDCRGLRAGRRSGAAGIEQFTTRLTREILPAVPLVALIDWTTEGVGADLALALAKGTDAIFVGQETGTPSQVMDVLRLSCGFLVHFPAFTVQLPNQPANRAVRGVRPDRSVTVDWDSEIDEIREAGIQALLAELPDDR